MSYDNTPLMTLPNEIFAEITSPCADTPTDESAELGRRVQQRCPLGRRAMLSRQVNGQEHEGSTIVRDLSASGVGLLHDERLPRGEKFIMGLETNHGAMFKVQCMTKRCESGGSGGFNYVIGASFVQLLSDHGSKSGHTAGASQKWRGFTNVLRKLIPGGRSEHPAS